MYPQTIKLRVDPKDIENWRHGAKLSGLTLSEWVRRKCNGEWIETKRKETAEKMTPDVFWTTLDDPRFCKHGVLKSVKNCRACEMEKAPPLRKNK